MHRARPFCLQWVPRLFLAALLTSALAACGGESTPADGTPGSPPGKPTLTSPAAGDQISSPVTVTGTGQPGVAVTVSLIAGVAKLGTAIGVVDATGSFSVDVGYIIEPGGGTTITIEASLSNFYGASEKTTVAVVQRVPRPSIISPAADAEVFSPLAVTGTGISGASVTARVLAGSSEIGTSEGTVASGVFSLSVSFEDQPTGTELTLSVYQSVGATQSSSATVAVTQRRLFRAMGQISQASGNNDGDVVYIRAYTSEKQVLDYTKQISLSVTPQEQLSATDYEISLPAGDYILRAFRDSVGRHLGVGGVGDGHPTLGGDAQSAPITINVSADSSGNDITLNGTEDISKYGGFDVRTQNESAEATRPWHGEGSPGFGLCGGFFLEIQTSTSSQEALDLTAPKVRFPNGVRMELIDDGGCGSAVANNTNHSYDWEAGDNRYSYGIPDPSASNAGDYIFFYRNIDGNLIHSEVDNVSEIRKLSRNVWLTQPTGAQFNESPRPTLIWNAVAEASQYEVQLGTTDGTYSSWLECWNSSRIVIAPEHQIAVPEGCALPDQYNINVRIAPQWIDPTHDKDVDAIASGIQNWFFNDSSGKAYSKTLSGSITNDSGETGVFLIEAASRGQDNWLERTAVTLQLPSSSIDYSIPLPVDPTCGGPAYQPSGYLRFAIDVDGSGDFDSPGNRGTVRNFRSLDLCNDLVLDIVLRPNIEVLSPDNNETDVSTTPLITWEDYATTYEAATGEVLDISTKSHILWVQDRSSGSDMPEIIWGLPIDATEFDFAHPPEGDNKYDVLLLGRSASLSELDPSTTYYMAIAIADCDYNDFLDSYPQAYPDDDYTACLGALLQSQDEPSWYASSVEIQFTVGGP